MSTNVETFIYDYKELSDALIDYGVNNREILDVILLAFGVRRGDDYIIMNNEYADHGDNANPYYGLGNVLDRIFDLEDSFGDVICTVNGVETREVPNWIPEQDVIDKVMRVRLGTEGGKP